MNFHNCHKAILISAQPAFLTLDLSSLDFPIVPTIERLATWEMTRGDDPTNVDLFQLPNNIFFE